MKVAILAGDKTDNVVSLLKSKSKFTLYYNSDIENGLSDVMLSSDIDKVLLLDTTFIRNGKELNYIEVFNALRNVGSAKPDIEIILISKSKKLFEASLKAMSSTYNFRAVCVDALNGQKIVDIILNKDKEPEVETVSEISADLNVGIVSSVSVEKIPDACPTSPTSGEVVGTYVEPEPLPKVEPKPEPIKKPSKFKLPISKPKSLTDIVRSKKIVLVTGNPNSGVTNLCSELAYVTAMSGLKTLLIDTDIFCHGINMYYDHLDSGACESGCKTGLLRSLKDLDCIDSCVHDVYDNLSLLGTRCDIDVNSFGTYLDDDSFLSDIVHTMIVDYDIVYIHTPVEFIPRFKELVKVSTEIVYACNSTINGVYTASRFLSTTRPELVRLYSILQRKLELVLTNYNTPKSVTSKNFCDVLTSVDNKLKLVTSVAGVVNYQKDFDEFAETKKLYSRDGKEFNNFVDIAYNILN